MSIDARMGCHMSASGRSHDTFPGLFAFAVAVPKARKLLVGGDGVPVEEEFLGQPVLHWVT